MDMDIIFLMFLRMYCTYSYIYYEYIYTRESYYMYLIMWIETNKNHKLLYSFSILVT